MLIRSTFNSRMRYLSSQNVRTASELGDIQQKITTGKEINKLSDDPWAVSELHQLRQGIKEQAQYKNSANRSSTMLNTIEYSMTAAINMVDRAKMLAVQFGNDSYSEEELNAGAEEILMMKDRLLEIANTDFHGRYVFAGEAYDTPPFDSTFAYVGSDTESEIDVSEVSEVTVGHVGSTVFQGNVDVFQVLDDLATAMSGNDRDGVRSAIDDMDDAFSQLDESRTRVGMDARIAMDVEELSASLEVELTARLSDVEDVDIAAALTRFSLIQTQYDINLQLTAKTKSLSLFNRI